MLGVMQLNNIGQKLTYATGSYVPFSDDRDVMEERPLFGLCRPWRFYEKGIGSACRDVRFQFFRTVMTNNQP